MNRKRCVWYVVIAVIFTMGALLGADTLVYAADFTGKTIVDVSIKDNKTITESSILAAVKLKAGDSFNAAAIQQDLQAIYDLGSFYDVQASFIEVPEGVNVVYSVIEKTKITDIVFKGNTKISDETL
ncbi:MAG TPA: POTRA domain-containing protein, partial [Negativicutes bacterium]